MFKNNDDFFKSVNSLIDELMSLGHPELSKKLSSAKSSSTIPGELFGEIELALRDIEKVLPDLMSVKRLLAALRNIL